MQDNKLKIDFSNTDFYNDIYLNFIFENSKRYCFLYGGAGSWKSKAITQKLIIDSFKKNQKYLIIRKTKESLKNSCYAELKNTVYDFGLKDFFKFIKHPLEIINTITNTSFIFEGLDDIEKIKSISWINKIWIEEATEIKKNDFDQLDLRLRGKGSDFQILTSFNPIDADHWLNNDFVSKGNSEDTFILKTTYLHNQFLDANYKAIFERLKETNPDYYKIYGLGEWWTLQGLIFENFKVIKEIPDEAELLAYGLDFWFTNDPTALVWVYKFNNELILREMLYTTHLTNQDIINYLKSWWVGSHVPIYADSSEPKSIEEIYKGGFNIKPAVKGPDSVRYGIDVMRSYKINITAKSENLIKEFKKYSWMQDKNGKSLNIPVDAFNHGIDASRYAITMALNNNSDLDIFIL